MTEETKNQTTGKNMVVIYYSTDEEPCTPFLAFAPIQTNWPLVAEAPDMTVLKHPKYSWPDRKWVETDGSSQGAQIAALQKLVKTLQDNNEEQVKKNTDLTNTLETVEKQNAEMLAMLSAMLAPNSATPPASNSASSTPQSSESSTSTSASASATSDSTKGSEK